MPTTKGYLAIIRRHNLPVLARAYSTVPKTWLWLGKEDGKDRYIRRSDGATIIVSKNSHSNVQT